MGSYEWSVRLGVLFALGSVMSAANAMPTNAYVQKPAPENRLQLANSNRLADAEGSDQDVQTFESFKLTSATQVARICWRGSVADAALVGFTLTFYPATSDLFSGPDVAHPLEVMRVSGHANAAPAGTNLSDYFIELNEPMSLAADTKYWLSIVAEKTDLSLWGWANSLDGDGKSIQSYAEFKVLPADGDRAFCLNEATTQPSAP
jgi:hypothetical protein